MSSCKCYNSPSILTFHPKLRESYESIDDCIKSLEFIPLQITNTSSLRPASPCALQTSYFSPHRKSTIHLPEDINATPSSPPLTSRPRLWSGRFPTGHLRPMDPRLTSSLPNFRTLCKTFKQQYHRDLISFAYSPRFYLEAGIGTFLLTRCQGIAGSCGSHSNPRIPTGFRACEASGNQRCCTHHGRRDSGEEVSFFLCPSKFRQEIDTFLQ